MHRIVFALAAAAVLLFAAPAAAQELVLQQQEGESPSAWRGSQLRYGHVGTTVGLDKGAELTWNPYHAHTLTIAPRYYFTDAISTGLTFSLEQELTDSDWTTSKHEVLFSDLFADLTWRGWDEPFSGVRLSGSLRVTLPTSKVSQAQTMVAAVAPTLRVARYFDLLSGAGISWSTRWNQRFNRESTARTEAAGIVGCGVDSSCEALRNTGLLNAWADLSTGPSLELLPTEDLVLTADFRWGYAFLYENAEVRDPFSGELLQGPSDFDGRATTYFGIGAIYTLAKEVNLSLGVGTPSPQIGADGRRRSPFFNRYTQLSFDVQLNLDAIIRSI